MTIGQKIALKYYPIELAASRIKRENLSNLIDNEVNEFVFQEKLKYAERIAEKEFQQHTD